MKSLFSDIHKISIIAKNSIMKIFKNIFLYFSAFVPMYFLIVVKFICGLLSKTIDVNTLSIFTLIVYALLVILGIIGLIWNVLWDKSESQKITITSKQNMTDKNFIGYFSIFVLFALSFELTKLSMVVDSLFIVLFIGIVYINNQMFYINPLLNLIGFKFYEIIYKKNGDEKKYSAKMFCRGEIILNKPCCVKLKNTNFSFIDKSK